MKTTATILAALAIGAGSLKAELTTLDFARLCEYELKVGYRYMATKLIADVECYIFEKEEVGFIFIPTGFSTYDDAVAAGVGSHVTAAFLTVYAAKQKEKQYDAGFAEGFAEGKQDAESARPEPEVRKAIPVAAAK